MSCRFLHGTKFTFRSRSYVAGTKVGSSTLASLLANRPCVVGRCTQVLHESVTSLSEQRCAIQGSLEGSAAGAVHSALQTREPGCCASPAGRSSHREQRQEEEV